MDREFIVLCKHKHEGGCVVVDMVLYLISCLGKLFWLLCGGGLVRNLTAFLEMIVSWWFLLEFLGCCDR